ncbi:bidirectional sugar transporter SWEET2a-like isoform X1 [Coffea arabica]|uniref:Bidirectional sugar transporter SWEET n=1 Tax=Coffea arabica TaxID=13443 RepID=A0ABM4VSV6_COFAR|nr:bidirectional sugar transporter SWEET2a isoform X1 [Coffea arabica]
MLQKKIRKLRISLSCRNCNDQKFEKNIGKMMIQQTGLISTYSVLSYAAGVAGNFFAFVLFVSPMPTFRRIIRRQSTEQFSGLPYVYALLNCLICLWYGMPIISPGIILVATVNSVGAIFQMIYIIIFIAYAERGKKVKMLGLLLAVFAVFSIIICVSLKLFEPPNRQLFVGYLSVLSLISMFASPLFIINLVIKTKSVEYMPFYLSLATFLMSLSFFGYGMFKQDLFISVPNGIGSLLGIIQLVLYFCYSRSSDGGRPRAPLLESYA